MPSLPSTLNRTAGSNGNLPPRRVVRGWFQGDRGPLTRTRIFQAFFILCAIVLAVRLFDLQLVQGHKLAALAKSEHQSSVVVPASRGQIYDAEGNLLVGDSTVYDVYADPALISASDRAADAKQLAAVLGVSESGIASQLSQQLQFVYLDKGVGAGMKTKLEALDIPGLGVIPRQIQTFDPSPIPGDSFAANLLGFVNADGQGQYGVEQYYNSLLTGTNGHDSQISDLNGNPILLSNSTNVAPKNGTDLYLGLNSTIQYYSEIALQKAMQTSGASSGMILTMNTKTGSIVSWAEEPTFNANDYQDFPATDYKDVAISNLYEPGSIMKVVTFAGGLNVNAITPGYTFDEGPVTIDGATIHDWDDEAHGMITMQTVLDMSLNDGAIKVEELEGQNEFYDNLQDFGIGAPTGIDLSGEVNQPLPPQSDWSDLTYAEASFGQGVDATPVEMLAAVNAIANGGVWVQPHVVNSYYNPNTGKTTDFKPITRRLISPSADATLRTMMTHVVDDSDGEGFNARIAGWQGEVAGKTGTASVAIDGTYSNSVVIVSFGGFIPASNPQFTELVVLNYPKVPAADAFGSILAAPVWKQVAQVIINQWHITP